MTATMTAFAETVLPTAELVLGYADRLLADIPAEKFGVMPEGVNANHPAWAVGHLAIYPEWMFRALGAEELADTDERFEELFKNKTEPVNDPGCTVYPSKGEITSRYFDRHRALIEHIRGVDEGVFRAVNPMEQMRERFPTVGAQCAFMLGAHAMLHLGQVSTWRRCMGMGSAM